MVTLSWPNLTVDVALIRNIPSDFNSLIGESIIIEPLEPVTVNLVRVVMRIIKPTVTLPTERFLLTSQNQDHF